MIDTPVITNSDAQITAVIHLTIKMEDCPKEFGPAVQELITVLAEQGISPTGPVYSYHFKRPTEIFDFEVGVPVSAAVSAKGRVKAGQLRAAKLARTTYHGPYEELGSAWGEFMQWLESNNLHAADDLWECYVAGPHQSDDPANWQTQLNRPLAD